MDARRLAYLKAMDIDVWQRRGLPQPDAGVPAAAVAPARVDDDLARMRRPPALLAEPVLQASPAALEGRRVLPPDVSAADWPTLENCVRACTACELHNTRTQTVFGVGNRQSQWLIIGEAPGADEDRQGEPFVGRAGQLLNAMLSAMGFPREQVFIANVLKCRPPGNRDPKPDEAASCAGYLARQIELINPRIILCVGRIAAQNLLNTDTPIGKLRGQVHPLNGRPMIVTYHPAYLLRSPGEKRKAWDDLQLALRTFAEVGGEEVSA